MIKRIVSEKKCKFYDGGYCKYKNNYFFFHPEEDCVNVNCFKQNCDKRHRRVCKYNVICKHRENCEYKHEINKKSTTKQTNKKENETFVEKAQDMEKVILTKEKIIIDSKEDIHKLQLKLEKVLVENKKRII